MQSAGSRTETQTGYGTGLLLPLLIAALVWCLAATALHAQDSRGTDFWCTFLPNYHGNTTGGERDSLYLVIAAEQPATGTLTLRDYNGAETLVPFAVGGPAEVYTIGLPWRSYELRGYNRSGVLSFGAPDNQNNVVARQSVHVTATSDVTVYALSQAVKTSDAMLVLPTDALGTEYVVLAYPTDGHVEDDPFGLPRLTGQSTPSQCAIVATEDGTDITIRPSMRVVNGPATPFTITLQRGDSYLLQADLRTNNPRGDLTGTRIESTRPVAVFAGHQRGLLPVSSRTLVSRDHLLEQMPPVPAWGKRYLLTPFPSAAPPPAPGATDLYRVLAAEDNTVVRIGGTPVATLRAGEFYEAVLGAPAVVEATQNVLVAQYRASSQEGDSERLGDPFFLIVPPLKQFLAEYTFAATQVRTPLPVYRKQYITVLCPLAAIGSVALDGTPVDETLFTPVPLSCYAYALIPVADGTHRITADQAFGLYVYGYGDADSYGYVGGMALTAQEDRVIAVQGDTTICRGDTARLAASGGVQYRWSGSGLSCTECPEPVATPEVSTLYTVVITDETGCEQERNVSVRVNQAPVVLTTGDTTLCAPGPVALSASGGVAFRWSPPEGLSCTDCAAPTAQPERSTTYRVTVTNSFGCTAVDSVHITLAAAPVITRTRDSTVCRDVPVQLHADGGVRYRWFPADGLSCTDCADPVALPEESRTYYVQVENEAGCSALDSVHLTVEPCNRRSSISGALVFMPIPVCDSSDRRCVVYNTGTAPLDILSWEVRGQHASSFSAAPALAPDTVPPLVIAPGDSLPFRLRYLPQDTGPHRAEFAVQSSATPGEVVAPINGNAAPVQVLCTLVPRVASVEAGERVLFDLRAESDNWAHADVRSLRVDIGYNTGWMRYGGMAVPGESIDVSWNITAAEQPGNAAQTHTTVLTAEGAAPLRANGTIATVVMEVFLDEDRLLTPSLHVAAVGREQCVDVHTEAATLDVATCARVLRPIRYTGQPFAFEIIGGTIVRTSTLDIRYGVPFATEVSIDVYDMLGRALHRYTASHQSAGTALVTLDLHTLPGGTAYIRYTAAGMLLHQQQVVLMR